MDYEKLLRKKYAYEKLKCSNNNLSFESYNKAFEIEYTHNSTAIEGNTLTLIETKVLLEDGISIGGKNIREIYEIINHNKAYQFIKKCTGEKVPLDENITKDIHQMLMDNIIFGGIYRNQEVRIGGASHIPPAGNEMFFQIKNFFEDLKNKTTYNPIELSAWTHAEFVRIHPFEDGNGRTSRLIMNYQLMINGFLPISISKENRLDYYNALDIYAKNRDLKPFYDMIFQLEEKQLDDLLGMFTNKYI